METNNNYTIVEGKNKDLIAVKSLIFGVLEEYGLKPDESSTDADLDDIEKNYSLNNGYFGLVLFNNTIAGTFGVYKLSVDTCELRKMYLKKEARGKGLGKIMMSKVMEIARSKGYRYIELETASVLKEAISLYEKYGFKEVKREHLAKRCDKAYILELN
jgi:putative acetyltransferase